MSENVKRISKVGLVKSLHEGKNLSSLLRKQLNHRENTEEIIEIVYEMQAGAYEKSLSESKDGTAEAIYEEIAQMIDPFCDSKSTFLDAGAGELSATKRIWSRLKSQPKNLIAFDISWSRVWTGKTNIKGSSLSKIKPLLFSAELHNIPLPSGSVDIFFTHHAIEPNKQRLPEIVKEAFRVSRDYCFIVEPDYESATNSARRRMDTLGYVRGLEDCFRDFGGRILFNSKLSTNFNKENPSKVLVVEVPKKRITRSEGIQLSFPGEDGLLKKKSDWYFSIDHGLAFPVLLEIPILRLSKGVFVYALS